MSKEGDRRPTQTEQNLSRDQRKQLKLLAETGTRVNWSAAVDMGLVQSKTASV